jgi:chorismate lyase
VFRLLNQVRWFSSSESLFCNVVAHDCPDKQLMRNWLTDKRSLTKKLESYFEESIQVHCVLKGFGKPLPYERRILKNEMSRTSAFVREVQISLAGEPILIARTVMLNQALTGHHHCIYKLRHQSIGKIIFSDPHWQRSWSAFGVVPLSDSSTIDHSAVSKKPKNIYGRQSIFIFRKKELLITELFLPAFWQVLKEKKVGIKHDNAKTTFIRRLNTP